MDDAVRRALENDLVIDITTTGRKTGRPRRKEIWFHNIDGHLYITGTPGRRDWYANLLSFSRQNVVLFTNESTLYSFAVVELRKGELRSLVNIFVEHLRLNLAAEDIPVEVIARVEAAYRVMGIARTNS